MDKEEVIKILKEISVLLELKDENPFKIRAYQNAARALESSDLDFTGDLKAEDFIKIKGVGSHIAERILELLDTGKLKIYEELKESIPHGLVEMISVPTLGPKKIKYLYDNLGISNIGQLEYACMENRLVDLPNFGEKTQENILKGIEVLKKYQGKYLYANIIVEAEAIHKKIKNFKHIKRSSLAGSVRRKKEDGFLYRTG